MNSKQGLIKIAAMSGAVWALCGGMMAARAEGLLWGDTPGQHPHYLHALSDLRAARALVAHGDERNVMADEMSVLVSLDRAIGETRTAARVDGKDLNDRFPIDANLSHRGRLQKALTLIGSAKRDLSLREEDSAALGLQRQAIGDVNAALNAAKRAVRDDFHDDHPFVRGAHPAYLKAMSDMRLARKLLSFPDEGNVVADEQIATGAINDALRSAKRAAIDDGLDIFANPKADTNLPRHNRLVRASRLLHDATSRLMQSPESDRVAQGVLYDTLFALNKAVSAADRAVRDDRMDDRGFGR